MRNKLAYIQGKVKSLPFDWKVIDGIQIIESDLQKKKYRALIKYKSGKIRSVHFGARGMQDFLDHNDEKRRKRFRGRFAKMYSEVKGNELSGLAYSYPLMW